MCLIAIAVHASPRYPIVIAANRDEFYERPTRPLHIWDDDPNIAGGRDLRAGGTWLAVTRDGRFAAVTNIRGNDGPPNARSRGALVGDFVRSNLPPLAYAQSIRPADYAGFHLLAGDRESVAHISTDTPARLLDDGIFAVSNAPGSIDWPKIVLARDAMSRGLEAGDIVNDLLRFLTTPRGGPIEEEIFVAVPDRGYGTRSSTVIVMTNDEIVMKEISHPSGEIAMIRISVSSRMTDTANHRSVDLPRI
ncbi:MAG: NRDE family protein [Acidobacteria bacterium]|nr:NRDE family protein [Acidobacteriota bacterium]MBV9068741.1 NRDE family protein [Acidobacteriota bacterium]MBV9188074.1 NRDE family protein [Acidobacteriota bacterium]